MLQSETMSRKIQVLAVIAYAILCLAMSSASVKAASGNDAIPFKVVNNKIIVQVMLDGKGPYSLALDSGAQTLMLSQKVIDSANIQTTSATAAAGTNDATAMQAKIGKMTLGSFELDNPITTVAPSSLPLDGYIGAPLFNAYVVEIDFRHNVLRLYQPDQFKANRGDKAVDLTIGVFGYPIVYCKLGGVPTEMQVNCGSAYPAELMPTFAQSHAVPTNFEKVGSVPTGASSGPSSADVFDMKSIAFGNNKDLTFVGPLPALVLPEDASNVPYDGRIGEPLLSGFVVTFDYAHSKMYLRESQEMQPIVPDSAQSVSGGAPIPPTPGFKPPASE